MLHWYPIQEPLQRETFTPIPPDGPSQPTDPDLDAPTPESIAEAKAARDAERAAFLREHPEYELTDEGFIRKRTDNETLRLQNIHCAHQFGILTGLAAIEQAIYGGPGPLGPKPFVSVRER